MTKMGESEKQEIKDISCFFFSTPEWAQPEGWKPRKRLFFIDCVSIRDITVAVADAFCRFAAIFRTAECLEGIGVVSWYTDAVLPVIIGDPCKCFARCGAGSKYHNICHRLVLIGAAEYKALQDTAFDFFCFQE